jgi:glycosyltransferase involved in cell wall biosynthesis
LKIALDTWVLAERFRHQGTSVYARNLFQEFGKIAVHAPELRFCLFANGDQREAEFKSLPGFGTQAAPLLTRHRLWRLGGASAAASKAKADVLFAPVPAIYPRGCVPTVCTIHDATPLLAPSHSGMVSWQQRWFLRAAVRRCRHIIAVSERSKSDLIEAFALESSRISVVYNGVSKKLFNDRPADEEKQRMLLARLGVARPYIFHHGTIQPRKNLVRLIEAHRRLVHKNGNLDFKLVLVGAPGWGHGEVVRAAQAHGEGRVILAGELEDRDLSLLLKGASLVVIPSLYEGFCLPMVEAMASGVPVIAANTSCLPEISGEALRYFDPLSIEDMAGCMQRVLESSELRDALINQGKEQASKFDWGRCARETLQILQQNACQ